VVQFHQGGPKRIQSVYWKATVYDIVNTPNLVNIRGELPETGLLALPGKQMGVKSHGGSNPSLSATKFWFEDSKSVRQKE
jgi:hypothetical protein